MFNICIYHKQNKNTRRVKKRTVPIYILHHNSPYLSVPHHHITTLLDTDPFVIVYRLPLIFLKRLTLSVTAQSSRSTLRSLYQTTFTTGLGHSSETIHTWQDLAIRRLISRRYYPWVGNQSCIIYSDCTRPGSSHTKQRHVQLCRQQLSHCACIQCRVVSSRDC